MFSEINPLIKGYKKFREKYFNGSNHAYEKLVRFGQNPKILVIACSDSRVDPAIVTKSEPGELFIIRNVANLVPIYQQSDDYVGTSAALEFGVMNLGIKHIIVFGHSSCGGIAALLAENTHKVENNHQDHISRWIEIAKPALNKTLELKDNALEKDKLKICEQLSIVNSLQNLQTYPLISEKIKQENLFLHGWYFNLTSGIIEQYDKIKDEFTELRDEF